MNANFVVDWNADDGRFRVARNSGPVQFRGQKLEPRDEHAVHSRNAQSPLQIESYENVDAAGGHGANGHERAVVRHSQRGKVLPERGAFQDGALLRVPQLQVAQALAIGKQEKLAAPRIGLPASPEPAPLVHVLDVAPWRSLPGQLFQALARRDVPEDSFTIFGDWAQGLPVGTKVQIVYFVAVSVELIEARELWELPESDDSVDATRGHEFAIGAHSHDPLQRRFLLADDRENSSDGCLRFR